MANEVDRLIDMLYEKIEEARPVALQTGMCKVDRDEMLDLLDELKAQLPVELKRSQELLTARDKFKEEAKREADRIVRQAEQTANKLVAESEIAYAAKEEARRIIGAAEDRSRQLLQLTNVYAEDALARTEESIQAALNGVKESRVRFRAVSTAKLQEQREKLIGKSPSAPVSDTASAQSDAG